MNYCGKCGSLLENSKKFCPKCGNSNPKYQAEQPKTPKSQEFEGLRLEEKQINQQREKLRVEQALMEQEIARRELERRRLLEEEERERVNKEWEDLKQKKLEQERKDFEEWKTQKNSASNKLTTKSYQKGSSGTGAKIFNGILYLLLFVIIIGNVVALCYLALDRKNNLKSRSAANSEASNTFTDNSQVDSLQSTNTRSVK